MPVAQPHRAVRWASEAVPSGANPGMQQLAATVVGLSQRLLVADSEISVTVWLKPCMTDGWREDLIAVFMCTRE